MKLNEVRVAEKDGRTFVSVTSAMRLIKHILDEPEDCYGPSALARFHALEGEACHAACLNWLAKAYNWIPQYELPPWPEAQHHDQQRWHNVISTALMGFMEFCDQYEVEPLGIEQEAWSKPLGLVGHIDLLCKLQWGTSRAIAVIDLKFVAHILETHRLQVRCYSRLDGIKGAHLGLIYQGNRETGHCQIEPVDLTSNLNDVAAVANAARLWAWKQGR